MRKAIALLFLLIVIGFSFGQISSTEPTSLKFDNNYFITLSDSLTDALSNKNNIAIGEATHGSKEFITIRKAIFFYLFRNLGYKPILL